MSALSKIFLIAVFLAPLTPLARCATGSETLVASEASKPRYYWRPINVGGTAQLVTLFCQPAAGSVVSGKEIPVVAVLRDTLGDDDPTNDRLTYVWLLTYERPDLAQRILSAIPFFYWHVGDGPKSDSQHDVSPLLDLTAPEYTVLSDLGHDLLQWGLLDPSTTPIRAISRTYRTNEVDQERLHLEEAVTYLRRAPASDDPSGLTRTQLDTIIARLELRKKVLGGLVTEHQTARLGQDANYQQERIRARNWELLRQCAEKGGLLFEPLPVAGASGQYAILWFPLNESNEPVGTSLGPLWNLLNVKNPWRDERFQDWRGPTFKRFTDNGRLLPEGATEGQRVNLAPLGVYSLNYPKVPLLLVDFRDKLHVRWHEMTQRAINEVTAGVIGISHFTNWYYYVGADLYDFYVARHGTAVNQSARLDCYSQFRVELELDDHLNPLLRKEIQERLESLAINPLESRPRLEIAAAETRFSKLQQEASGELVNRVDRDRRKELAAFGESKTQFMRDHAFHVLSFGAYTHRVQYPDDELASLDRYRRMQYQLNFLDSLVKAGTQPEVSYDSASVQASVRELSNLMQGVQSSNFRARAAATLESLKQISQDAALQSDCSQAVAAIRGDGPVQWPGAARGTAAGGVQGAALDVHRVEALK